MAGVKLGLRRLWPLHQPLPEANNPLCQWLHLSPGKNKKNEVRRPLLRCVWFGLCQLTALGPKPGVSCGLLRDRP